MRTGTSSWPVLQHPLLDATAARPSVSSVHIQTASISRRVDRPCAPLCHSQSRGRHRGYSMLECVIFEVGIELYHMPDKKEPPHNIENFTRRLHGNIVQGGPIWKPSDSCSNLAPIYTGRTVLDMMDSAWLAVAAKKQ